MSRSGKHLVGYGDGFWGAEHFPVKFSYDDAMGFIIQPHAPEGMQDWLSPEDEVASEAKGWVPPFTYPNGTLINYGVGTWGTTWPYYNMLRVVPKEGTPSIKRGLAYTKTPAFNTVEWMSSNFSLCVSWKGPSNRYGPDEDGTAHHAPGHPFLQGQTVLVAMSGASGRTVLSVDYDSQSHDVSGYVKLPLIANRTSYSNGFYSANPVIPEWYEYSFGGILPSDWSFLYSENVYLNGKLIAKAPIDNNPPAGGEVCGQPGYVQGASIRTPPADAQYYTDIEEEVPDGTEEWLTVITHEWWLEDATLCRLLYVADRVYTIPLRYASGKNPGIADEGLLSSLAAQIAGASAALKPELVEAYKKEYQKWRLVETFLTPIDNTVPATFEEYKPWLDYWGTYKSQGEHYSLRPWLFSQSGTKALQSRNYRNPDPAAKYLGSNRTNRLLREIELTNAAIPTATWGYAFAVDLASELSEFALPYTGAEERIGKMFIAADYKGETLVTASANGSHSFGAVDFVDFSLVTPWIADNTLPAMWTDFAGNQTVMVLSALDLRYDFVCYGLYDVTQPTDYYVNYTDWVVDSTGTPVQLGGDYNSGLQSSYRSETCDDAWQWVLPGTTGDGPSHFPWQANGTYLRFLNANTYVLSHNSYKRSGPLNEEDWQGWMTPREYEDGYLFQGWVFGIDMPGHRIYTSRVVVNGVYVGTLPDYTNSYAPYLGDNMLYGAITIG